MVDEFSAFARMPQPVIRPESLGDLIDQAVFLQRQAHPLLKYEVRKPNDAVIADCDSRQIAQALTNLLQNASDAIDGRSSEGGLALPRGLIEVELTADAERAFIIVADNGKGLPLTGRDRLTEPYVTTRVKGTGLGLAIVKKIMEDHAGSLDMQDNSGGGARVVLSIPLHQPSQAKATQQKFSTQLRYGA